MNLLEYCHNDKKTYLLEEWSDLNGDLTPKTVLTTNNAKVWWQCVKCKRKWKESVYLRIKLDKKGCPDCREKADVMDTSKSPKLDLIGKKFDRLEVIDFAGIKKESFWRCRCICGKEIEVIQSNLLLGKTTSCGCKRSEVTKENFKKNIHFVEGTCIEKIASKTTLKNNTSGFRGVSKRPNGRFRVGITFKGKRYELGNYDSLDEAIEARLAGEVMVDEFVENYRRTQQIQNQEG